MTQGEQIKSARKRRGFTQGQLAEAIGVVQSAVSAIEKDELRGGVAFETLIRIADALDAPEILIHHCDTCLIREHVMMKLFPDLNNIRRDPAVMVSRLRKEMIEAAEAAERLAERYSDADFRNRPDYAETFEREMEQILDVKRGIEILEFELILSGLHSREDIDRVYARQQRKCEDHGHHVPDRRTCEDRRNGNRIEDYPAGKDERRHDRRSQMRG